MRKENIPNKNRIVNAQVEITEREKKIGEMGMRFGFGVVEKKRYVIWFLLSTGS